MNATDDVAAHIRSSLLDLQRRVDRETARKVTLAVLEGAAQALSELTDAPAVAGPDEARGFDIDFIDSGASSRRH